MTDKQNSSQHTWIAFVSVVLLLLGIYGSARTLINLYAYEKYPPQGVFSMPFMGGPYYGPNENDCLMMPPPIGDPTLVGMSAQEKKDYAQNMKDSCLLSAKQARDNAKTSDVSQSMLFLFMGAGILVAKKFFFS